MPNRDLRNKRALSNLGSEEISIREACQRGDWPQAVQLAERWVKTHPQNPDAHLALGRVLMAANQKPQALAYFQEAIRLAPNHRDALLCATQILLELRSAQPLRHLSKRLAELDPRDDRAWHRLSIGYSLEGRWREALDAIEQALELEPESVDYMVGKAQLLAREHVHALAIDWYRKALALVDSPQIANELAESLREEGRIAEAGALVERYAIPMPESRRPNLLVANILTDSRRFDEAAAFWDLAIRNSPDPTSGIKARADAEIRNGRIDQAENLLKEALDQYPDSVLLFGSLAPIIRIGANDSALVDRMERLYSEAALRPALRQTLAFALGKAFNDLSDYRKAIDFYDEANRLREQMFPESHRFNRSALAASTEFQIRYFTKERILRYRDRALQDPRPIFVIGMIRSGTSLTEQILSGHSQIHAAGELMFWNGHWPEVIHPTRETWRYGRTLELGREYLQILERDSAGRPFTTDKHPMNYQFTAPLHTVFPQAKFVQILRHPVDNLLSIWMTPMTSGIQFVSRRDDLVFLYRQYQRLTRHLEELLPPTQYHAFRYEDITSQPELEIRSLLTYLGLPPEPACFEPENRERTVRTPSAQQVRQPIHPRSQQRWKPYEPWLAEFAELLESE